MRIILAVRALFFVFLLPGMVAGYIPYRLLTSAHQLDWPRLSIPSGLASLVCAVGASVLLWCVWEFFAAGHGTLAPIDPPKHLVVSGLYRITRDPMYNGVACLLLGEAWLFSSVPLLKYALAVMVFFHLFVVIYEEPTLEHRFGESYQNYKGAVPRWGFTINPFQGP